MSIPAESSRPPSSDVIRDAHMPTRASRSISRSITMKSLGTPAKGFDLRFVLFYATAIHVMMSGAMAKQVIGARLSVAAAAMMIQALASGATDQALDFETYRTRVEPIFLQRRPG